MKEDTFNRKDIVRSISDATGYKMSDIEEILELEGKAIGEALAQGYNVKNHKWWKLELEKRPEKKAWDGFKKTYFIQPESYVVKFKQLSLLKKAIERYNEKE